MSSVVLPSNLANGIMQPSGSSLGLQRKMSHEAKEVADRNISFQGHSLDQQFSSSGLWHFDVPQMVHSYSTDKTDDVP